MVEVGGKSQQRTNDLKCFMQILRQVSLSLCSVTLNENLNYSTPSGIKAYVVLHCCFNAP